MAKEDYLDGLARAVDNYTRGATAVTVDRVQRERQLADDARMRELRLQDIASNRQYERETAEEASARRIKEFEYEQQMRLADDLAKRGIDTTDKDGNMLSRSELAKKVDEDNRGNATKLLSHYDNQIKSNADQIKTAQESLRNAATGVSPEINREALRRTLADPSLAKIIDPSKRAQLQKALDGKGDITPTVAKVFKEIGDKWWGWFGNAKDADLFYATYGTNVNTLSTEDKQIDMATTLGDLKNLYAVRENLSKQKNDHITQWGKYLPDSVFAPSVAVDAPKQFTTPPENPDDGLRDIGKPEPKPDPGPSLGQTFEKQGALGVLGRIDPERIPVVGNALQYVNAFIPGMRSNRNVVEGAASLPMVAKDFLTGSGSISEPISRADVLANRGAVDARVNPNQTLMQASPEEWAKVEQYAVELGLTPQRKADADAAIRRGDPKAIATANQLLKMIRANKGLAGAAQGAPPY